MIIAAYGFIFRSTDNGKSWSKISNGLVPEFSYGSVACGKGGNIYMTAQSIGQTLHPPAVHSTDDGLTWSPLPFTQGLIAASPSGRVLFTGTDILRYSDNNGITWTDYGGVNQGIDGNGYFAFLCADADSGFYSTIYGRLLHTNAPGTFPWYYFSVPLCAVTCLIADTGGVFISATGTALAGTFRSTDNGTSWTPIYDSGTLDMSYWFIIDSSKDIIGGYERAFRLTESGKNLIHISAIDTHGTFTSGVVDTNGNIFLAADDGMFFSSDNGITWKQVSDKIIYSLIINNFGDLFAGSDNSIFRSEDGGVTWKLFIIDSTIRENSSLAVRATIDLYGDIFAFVDGTGENGWGMYRSIDNGETWKLFNNGLPNMQNNIVYNLLAAPNGVVFAATDTGIYIHEPESCEWTPFSTGLSTISILSLTIDKQGRLYAGSDGGGVFSSTETFNNPSKLTGVLFPQDLDFGTVTVGDTKCMDITIKNIGLAPFNLTKSFLVLDPVPFSVDPKSVAMMPIVIQPKDSVLISICFHPPQPAVYSSEIDWSTDIDPSLCIITKSQSILH